MRTTFRPEHRSCRMSTTKARERKHVEFRDMTRQIGLSLLSLAACLLEVQPRNSRSSIKEPAEYCQIDPSHTVCLFPYDDKLGGKCRDVEDSDLNQREIQRLLELHNTYRNCVANGKEDRGNPGPQPLPRYIMELAWDEELAYIARRWALQCNLKEKDRSRDVERFAVWQNVHVLYVDAVGSGTSDPRTLDDHIRAWYDEVEYFDSSKVGMVNLADEREQSSYIAFASATIAYVGCGRAVYTAELNKTAPSDEMSHAEEPTGNGSRRRVEVLVCNYGPVDRTQPQQLYEIGKPGSCPPGTVSSPDYHFLCRKSKNQREAENNREANQTADSSRTGNSATISCGFEWLTVAGILTILRLLSM